MSRSSRPDVRYFSAALFIVAIFSVTVVCGQTVTNDEPDPFGTELYAFGIEDEFLNHSPCKTLFVGSSSIRFWFTLVDDFPDLEVIRRGFGGSQMEHANHYFDQLVARHRPSRIILYEGENDIHMGDAPESVLAELEVFLGKKTATLGETPVYFLALKPSRARAEDFDRQTATNDLVKALADNRKDLVFVDVVGPMMADGKPKDIFLSDNLHMTQEGYAIWSKVLANALETEIASTAPGCR